MEKTTNGITSLQISSCLGVISDAHLQNDMPKKTKRRNINEREQLQQQKPEQKREKRQPE